MTVAETLPQRLVGDTVRLRAALENLIDNAVKFSERGAVRLDVRSARAARGHVRLTFTVTDNGIGLKPAEIKRLFRPFVQANADIARRYGGAGLGLAVVKVLAKLMGGDLTVTSETWSRFEFILSVVVASRARHDVAERCNRNNIAAAIACDPVRRGRSLSPGHPGHHLTELRHRADFVGSGEEAICGVELYLRRRADGRDTSRHRRARGDAPHPRA